MAEEVAMTEEPVPMPTAKELVQEAASLRLDADAAARCRELVRTVEVEAVCAANAELWAYPDAEAAAAAEDAAANDKKGKGGKDAKDAPKEEPTVLQASSDSPSGSLFLSHVWDAPESWAKYFRAQPYAAAKHLHVCAGLQRATERRVLYTTGLHRAGRPPRVWMDCASLPDPVAPSDHPLEQVIFGPFRTSVRNLKEHMLFPPAGDRDAGGYTVLELLEGHTFEGGMRIRKFDIQGRPSKDFDLEEVKWTILPGWYWVRSAVVLAEDMVSPKDAAEKPAFQPRAEQLLRWCQRLALRDEIWVELTLGTVRAECLLYAETMLALHGGFVAAVTWNYFDRLWPLYEWALYCARRGPERVQLAADAPGGVAVVEYHRALRRLSVFAAGVRDARDRPLLLANLERVFFCPERQETLDFKKPDPATLTAPVQQRVVDYSSVERYVRATAIGVYAREAALAASRHPGSDDEGGWASLAEEFGFSELYGALKEFKPCNWSLNIGNQGHEAATAEEVYAERVEAWWSETVLPVLALERGRAMRRR